MFGKFVKGPRIAVEKLDAKEVFGTAQSQGRRVQGVVQALVFGPKIGDSDAGGNSRSHQDHNVLAPLQEIGDGPKDLVGSRITAGAAVPGVVVSVLYTWLCIMLVDILGLP